MMDGLAIGAAALGDVGRRMLPSEAIGPRAAGTRAMERATAEPDARESRAGDAARAATATRP